MSIDKQRIIISSPPSLGVRTACGARGLGYNTLPSRLGLRVRLHPSIFALCIAILAISCSSVRRIRPLDVGQSAVNVSIGGPVLKVAGVYTPIPLLSLGYNYGLLRNLDLEGGLGVTQAVYKILALDLGANWRPLIAHGWIPGIIATPKIHILTNFTPASLRVYPDILATLWWQHKNWLYPYLGIENWIEYHTERTDGNPQTHHWLITPYLGASFANGAWQYQIEGRVYEPNLRNDTGAPARMGFGPYGVLGLFLGIGYEFGDKK